jgi:hypothetical protein
MASFQTLDPSLLSDWMLLMHLQSSQGAQWCCGGLGQGALIIDNEKGFQLRHEGIMFAN